MTNYYPNATLAELLALLESLQRRATVGQVSMTTNAGDQQMRTFQGGSKINVEMRRILYARFVLDPGTYSNPYADRVRRTSADYRTSR